MGYGCPRQIAQHGYRGVGIALSGEHEVAQRAAAELRGGDADQSHAKEVPEVVVMGYWLLSKAPEIYAAGTKVAREVIDNQCSDEKGGDAAEKVEVFYQ